MLAAPLLMFLLGAPAVATIKPAGEIEIRQRDVLLEDVADVSGLDEMQRRRAVGWVIARLPAGRSRITVSRAGLASLVRRSFPGLQASLESGSGDIVLSVRARPVGERPADAPCAALTQPIASNAAIDLSVIAPASCVDPKPGLVRFDRRDRVLRAASALPAGTLLGKISLPYSPTVQAGERLTLTSIVGPVRVERAVTALQAGRPGQRVFVRATGGEILSAPLDADSSREDRK